MTANSLSRADLAAFAAARRADFERWLIQLVDIPSVSVDPANAADVRRCAEAAVAILESVGAGAELIETGRPPHGPCAIDQSARAPTVTIYNHLDVQPADGDAWRTNPFQLQKQDDRYIGRGATDDKGPAITALLGALAARDAGVPVNIAFLWELEEEVGSDHFASTITEHRDKLATDCVVVSDTIWVTRGNRAVPPDCAACSHFA